MITNSAKQKVFNINHKLETGEVKEGQFTTKKLSIMDRSKIGVRKSQLSGGMYTVRDDQGNPTGQGLDEDTDFLNHMISHLEVALIQKPIWFDLNNIDDADLVRKVFKEVIDFEASFRRPGNTSDSGNDGSSQEASSTESSQQTTGRLPTQVVGKEVQAALDA